MCKNTWKRVWGGRSRFLAPGSAGASARRQFEAPSPQVLAVTSGSDFRRTAFAPVSDSASSSTPAQPEATRVRAIRERHQERKAREQHPKRKAREQQPKRKAREQHPKRKARERHPKRKLREQDATTQVREWKQACQRRERSAS